MVPPLGGTFALSLCTADSKETPLTVGSQVSWSAPQHIPALLEPARVPRGAGSALLSWLALLMDRAGQKSVRYRGPYPTPQLFASLLECFEPISPDNAVEAQAAFLHQDPETVAFAAQPIEPAVDFQPQPCERRLDPDNDLVAQLRGEPGNPGSLQRVFVGTTSFDAPDLGGLSRHSERRLRYCPGTQRVAAEVWLLGQPWRTAALLDGRGRALGRSPEPARPAPEVVGDSRLSPGWTTVMAGLLARRAPRALAPLVAETVSRGLSLRWGDAGDARCAWESSGNQAAGLETGEAAGIWIHSALAGRAADDQASPQERRTGIQQLVSEVALGLEPLVSRVAAARLALRGEADPTAAPPAEAGADLAATTARLIHDLDLGHGLPRVRGNLGPPLDGLRLEP